MVMYQLDQMKKVNPNFNDDISICFGNYVVKRAEGILLTYPQIKFGKTI